MDPVKIILFIAVFVALLIIGRMLAASSDVHASELPHPAPQPGSLPEDVAGSIAPDGRRRAPLTGAEIDFPVPLPPVKLQEDGRFNRPNILNYHFDKTDLIRGPDDLSSFCDDLFIDAQDPLSQRLLTYGFTVATPVGLRKVMEDEKFESLYIERGAIIVPRWDLKLILGTALDELIKSYGAERPEIKDDEEAAGEEP